MFQARDPHTLSLLILSSMLTCLLGEVVTCVILAHWEREEVHSRLYFAGLKICLLSSVCFMTVILRAKPFLTQGGVRFLKWLISLRALVSCYS